MFYENLFLGPGHHAPQTGRSACPYGSPIAESWKSEGIRGSRVCLQTVNESKMGERKSTSWGGKLFPLLWRILTQTKISSGRHNESVGLLASHLREHTWGGGHYGKRRCTLSISEQRRNLLQHTEGYATKCSTGRCKTIDKVA